MVDFVEEAAPTRADVLANLMLICPNHEAAVYETTLAGLEAEEVERVWDPYPAEWATDAVLDILMALPPPTLEKDVQELLGLFPRTEQTWLREQLREGQTVEQLANYIFDPANIVPKLPKLSRPKAPKTWLREQLRELQTVEQLANYIFDPANIVLKLPKLSRPKAPKRKSSEEEDFFREPFRQQVDEDYVKTATLILNISFPKVTMMSVRAVFFVFGSNFAPALRALQSELNSEDWGRRVEAVAAQELKIPCKRRVEAAQKLKIPCNPMQPTKAVVIEHGQTKPPVTTLKLLKRRKKLAELGIIPERLSKEINWLAIHHPDIHKAISTDRGEENEGGQIECEICCDERSIDFFRACVDGHMFCIKCILSQAKEAAYGQSRMKCLDGNCKEGYDRETLESILPEGMRETLSERESEQAISSAGMEGFVRCKFCAWGAILEARVEEDKVFHCGSDPDHDWCRICERPWDDEHIGKRCEELESDLATTKRRRLEEALTSAVLRKCHKCGLKFQKVEGCNKMTCTCKATSCYLCKKPDIHYNHFCGHAREPGEGCTSCAKCSLWEKPERVDKEKLREVQEAMKAEQAFAVDSVGIGHVV